MTDEKAAPANRDPLHRFLLFIQKLPIPALKTHPGPRTTDCELNAPPAESVFRNQPAHRTVLPTLAVDNPSHCDTTWLDEPQKSDIFQQRHNSGSPAIRKLDVLVPVSSASFVRLHDRGHVPLSSLLRFAPESVPARIRPDRPPRRKHGRLMWISIEPFAKLWMQGSY